MTALDRCPHCGWTPAEQDALSNKAALVPELLAALEAVVAFNEYDSLVDQQTDAHLRASAAAAWEQARTAITKAQEVA